MTVRKRIIALVCVLVLVVGSAAPVLSQGDDEVPYLMQMLALVPESASLPADYGGIELSYADYRAAAVAWPEVPQLETWAEWEAIRDQEAGALWVAATRRLVCGDPELYQFFMSFDPGAIEKYGFDFFDIHRTFLFGRPPEEGIIYGGDFDLDAIAAAHAARTYTEHDLNGVTLWCGPVGCENGDMTQQYLPGEGERDPETLKLKGVYMIFGGRFGRQQPVGMIPGYLMSSSSWPVMQSLTAAIQGSEQSLLDLPAYRAAADLLTEGDALLVQARFLHPFDVGAGVAADVISAMLTGEDERAQYLEASVADYGLLMPYELAVMADLQDGPDQVNIIGLVYSSESAAEHSAEELTQRLGAFRNLYTGDILIEEEGIQAVMDAPRVFYSEETNRWVAVAAARYPLPTTEPDETGFISAPGWLLMYWYQAYLEMQFAPLWFLTGE
ncbi:MAG: hypothetical protein JXJ20_04250 [Anaerolineae bacterium]|nr:hypothetical protein [Anaerolineae bacterium]